MGGVRGGVLWAVVLDDPVDGREVESSASKVRCEQAAWSMVMIYCAKVPGREAVVVTETGAV